MFRAPLTLDLFRHATESARRLVTFIVFEGVFVVIGVILAVFTLPLVRATADEANTQLSPLVEAAFAHYWLIVVGLVAYAILSGPLMPRISGRLLTMWLLLGALLPLLIVVVPLIAVIGAYGAFLGDLQ